LVLNGIKIYKLKKHTHNKLSLYSNDMAEYGPNKSLLPIVADAPLTSFTTRATLKGADLWRDQPCLIMVVRRPGCGLCRAQAKQLASLRPQLKELGVKLVAVSHQEDSAADFVNLYFGKDEGAPDGDPLYIDSTKAFYKAVGQGSTRTGSLLGLFSRKFRSNKSEADKMGSVGNLSGDYSHLGGVLVVGKGDAGGVLYSFQEVNFGDKAPVESVLRACRDAADKK
jgi:hypothetical protein